MKKIVWVYLLGLSILNISWSATDLQDEDVTSDEAALQHSVDPDENESQKFSNLVKSTMDLLGPEEKIEENKTEISQAQ